MQRNERPHRLAVCVRSCLQPPLPRPSTSTRLAYHHSIVLLPDHWRLWGLESPDLDAWPHAFGLAIEVAQPHFRLRLQIWAGSRSRSRACLGTHASACGIANTCTRRSLISRLVFGAPERCTVALDRVVPCLTGRGPSPPRDRPPIAPSSASHLSARRAEAQSDSTREREHASNTGRTLTGRLLALQVRYRSPTRRRRDETTGGGDDTRGGTSITGTQ